MQGTFIILEGGEGAGKTTLAKNLEAEFNKCGFEVVRTREPGGTPWGEKIRSLLVQKDESLDHHMAPATQLLGHYMARFEHLERVILPALKAGKVVISDRFELSSFAYQVHSLSEGALHGLFQDLHKHVTERLRPYRSIYLFCDVHPEIGLSRVESRGDTKSIFDSATLDFHHRVREGMQKAQTCIDPHFVCVTIDASCSADEMLTAALKACRTE
jgi:dTMP kinase